MSIGDMPGDLEYLIEEFMGSNWRYLSEPEVNGAWGIAIVYSALQGVPPSSGAVSKFLNVDKWRLHRASHNLSMNGVFIGNKFEKDKRLLHKKDPLTWLYYAGYAAGFTGPYLTEEPRRDRLSRSTA